MIAKEKYDKLQAKLELAEDLQESNRLEKINASKIAERIMEARKFERQQIALKKKDKTEQLFRIKSEKILMHKESELNERLKLKREKEIDSLNRVEKLRKKQSDLQQRMTENALIKDEMIQKKIDLGIEIENTKLSKIKEKMRLQELTRLRLEDEKEKFFEEKHKQNQVKLKHILLVNKQNEDRMQQKKANIIIEMKLKDDKCQNHLISQTNLNRDKRISKLLKELAVKDNVEKIT